MRSLPTTAKHIIDTFTANNFDLYAVGGSVRDTLMDRPTHGWDFTTNAKPEQILALFPESFCDNQFGTVSIKIYDEPHSEGDAVADIFEITTYRSEKGYGDFRHPDKVTWGSSLTEDLSRRDFTINAIAWNGVDFIDPYDGQTDIKNKIIRTVGVANDRFSEDALRMMRAVRIASQLGFFIDPDTTAAIKKNAGLLRNISAERIQMELYKILASDFAADGILLLKNTGILEVIIPELHAEFAVGQKSPKRHHLYDVGTHSVMALKNCPSKDPVVRFATLLHDVGKPPTMNTTPEGVITFYNHEVVGARIIKSIASRLRLSKKDTDKIYTLVRWHQFSVDERQTDSAIRRIIRRVTKEYLDDMLALRIGDRLGGGALETSWRLELFKKRLIEVQKQPFTVSDLTVNGYDVMTIFSCKPGKIIGDVLTALFADVENAVLPNDREKLLEKLKEMNASGKFAS
jgi:tRNA nucleotidyltransferase (CCA-adding enzyme)